MTRIVNPLWTAYNAINNEGGEGYNPHPQHIEDTAEPQWSILDGRADRLQDVLNGMSERDPRFAKTDAEYNLLRAAAKLAGRPW